MVKLLSQLMEKPLPFKSGFGWCGNQCFKTDNGVNLKTNGSMESFLFYKLQAVVVLMK